jgi:hypothetical protein
MFPTYVGLLGNSSTPYRSGIQSPNDGIPLLSGFILTAEWSLTSVTLATIGLYFHNCLKLAHKSWGRTRLACGLTMGDVIAANPRSCARTRVVCAPRANDSSIRGLARS